MIFRIRSCMVSIIGSLIVFIRLSMSIMPKAMRVKWVISEKEFLEKDLAPGMQAVVKLIHDDRLSECYSS